MMHHVVAEFEARGWTLTEFLRHAQMRRVRWDALIESGGRLSRQTCLKCGGDVYWVDCEYCGGEGYLELYEQDPLWYDEDDVEECQVCEGLGGWNYCPTCNSAAVSVSAELARRAEGSERE